MPTTETVAENAILLHACCGPCSIVPVERLRDMGLVPTLYFYNPNIHPLTEYLRRREALLEAAARLDAPVILADSPGQDGPAAAHPGVWLRDVAPLAAQGESRCRACYELRLARTAQAAAALGFARFSSTLLYSKHQKHEAIRAAGQAASGPGVAFVDEDFRPGWSRGISISRKWGLYRQQYCGCLLDEYDRYKRLLDEAST